MSSFDDNYQDSFPLSFNIIQTFTPQSSLNNNRSNQHEKNKKWRILVLVV